MSTETAIVMDEDVAPEAKHPAGASRPPDDEAEENPDAQESQHESATEQEEICADLPLPQRIEAILLSTDKPLTEQKLANILGISGSGIADTIRKAIDELNDTYSHTKRSFRIERVAGGFQFLTTTSFGPLLSRLHTDRQQSRLSPAALETLAIVAYRQPVLRAEIEAIRGVAAGEVLRGLMERRLVKITGRAEELGRPMLYGTTREFLQVFGLASLDDLPEVQGLNLPSQTPTATKPKKSAASGDESSDSDSPAADATPEATAETSDESAASTGNDADDSNNI